MYGNERGVGERSGRTPAQVVFDFELDPADIDRIAALDRGEAGRTGPNPDRFAYVPG
jgi:hypothetical protein